MEDNQEVFNLHTPFKQPPKLEKSNRVDEDDKSIQQSNQKIKTKLREILDKDENGEFKIWRAKHDLRLKIVKVQGRNILTWVTMVNSRQKSSVGL